MAPQKTFALKLTLFTSVITAIAATSVFFIMVSKQKIDPIGYYVAYLPDEDSGNRIWLKPDGKFASSYREPGAHGARIEGPKGSYEVNGNKVNFWIAGKGFVGYAAIEDVDIPGSLVFNNDKTVLRVPLAAVGMSTSEVKYVKVADDFDSAHEGLDRIYSMGWESRLRHP